MRYMPMSGRVLVAACLGVLLLLVVVAMSQACPRPKPCVHHRRAATPTVRVVVVHDTVTVDRERGFWDRHGSLIAGGLGLVAGAVLEHNLDTHGCGPVVVNAVAGTCKPKGGGHHAPKPLKRCAR